LRKIPKQKKQEPQRVRRGNRTMKEGTKEGGHRKRVIQTMQVGLLTVEEQAIKVQVS